MSQGIVLASATSPTEQAVFDELVKRGIEQDQFSSISFPTSDRIAHAWPVPEADHVDADVIEDGDFVLFYRGSNRYTWAARVERIDTDPELADQFTSYVSEQAPANVEPYQEFSDTILWLEIPIPIELESYRLHDMLDLGQEALTRTVVPPLDTVQTVIDEYGSIEELIRTARKEPSVYIELTSLQDKPYKQSDGELRLGTAVFSRSESTNGQDIYGTLREPRLGDIVLHMLKDTRELRGVSTVASTLRTDFAGPPDDSWEQAARGDGYFLPLGNYEELDNPIGIDTDLFRNDDYRERLQTIYEATDGLVYDKNFELAQDAYFTECPIDLVYLCLAEAPDLLEHIRKQYWDLEHPPGIEQYDSVTEAIVDVRIRLPFAEISRTWFNETFTQTVIEALTSSLSSVQPNATLTQTEATHCQLIEQIYTDWESDYSNVAERLAIGRTNRLGAPETLFFVLFRELQSAMDVSPNMNQVKARTILNGNYEVETPIPTFTPADDTGPLEAREKPEQGEEIARQLTDSGQMVFYGPPGTGKTYTAKRFAHWWLNEQPNVDPHTGQFETVTFHPSFSYEDFIEGLSVNTTDEGTVSYDEEPGVFLRFAEQARQEHMATEDGEEPPRYVLVIDEINRGNLAQIFGEMITALEVDKRQGGDNETMVSLAHSGDRFMIPPNLYLIGTMNTADRSIALVDAALRRRFRFLSFPPKLRLLREEYDLGSWRDVHETARTPGADHQLLAQSLIAIHQINARIRDEPDLGRGKQIGHSFLFDVESDEEIVDTWRFEILPLLEEYLFGQYERIREALFVGNGDELFDWNRQQIRSFDAVTLSRALEPFAENFDPASASLED